MLEHPPIFWEENQNLSVAVEIMLEEIWALGLQWREILMLQHNK